jgi:predicted phosphate transport protein (TIGR00153 family)
MKFLPREEKFYTLFNQQVEVICEASRLLLEGAKAGNSRLAEVAKQIILLEHKGDEIIHEIFTSLNQTFITPLDPEDIHNLSSKLDDVLDGIEDAVHRMVAYRLECIPQPMIALAGIIHRCCLTLEKAFRALEKDEKVMEDCIEVNRLENEADILVRDVVADLFETQTDAILIIKLKEIYEFLESTTDRCEDAADVLQNVMVKNS